MRRLATLSVGLTLGGAALVGAAPAALAVCDAYSGTCVEPSEAVNPPPTTTTRDNGSGTLPVTGGELVLLFTAGAATLGTGAVLVAAGRRRREQAEPA